MELGGLILEKVVMFLFDLFIERVVILLKKRNVRISVKSVKYINKHNYYNIQIFQYSTENYSVNTI